MNIVSMSTAAILAMSDITHSNMQEHIISEQPVQQGAEDSEYPAVEQWVKINIQHIFTVEQATGNLSRDVIDLFTADGFNGWETQLDGSLGVLLSSAVKKRLNVETTAAPLVMFERLLNLKRVFTVQVPIKVAIIADSGDAIEKSLIIVAEVIKVSNPARNTSYIFNRLVAN